MLSQVYSSAIFGVDAYLMEIEVNYRQSPRSDTVIVGLPDAAGHSESSSGSPVRFRRLLCPR